MMNQMIRTSGEVLLYTYPTPATNEMQIREPESEYSDTKSDAEDAFNRQDMIEKMTQLSDQVNDLHALNSYFYITTEMLLKNADLLTKDALYGFWLNVCWLHQQNDEMKRLANDIHSAICDAEEKDDSATL